MREQIERLQRAPVKIALVKRHAAHRIDDIVKERLDFVFLLARRILRNDDIRLHEIVELHEVLGHHHMKADVGKALAKGGQSERKPQRRKRMRDAQRERMTIHAPHRLRRLRDIHDRQIRRVVENAARVGQRNVPARALEQRHFECVFEFLDLPAHRRLRDAQHFRSLRETFIPRRGDEAPERTQRGHLGEKPVRELLFLLHVNHLPGLAIYRILFCPLIRALERGA